MYITDIFVLAYFFFLSAMLLKRYSPLKQQLDQPQSEGQVNAGDRAT